MSIKDRLKSAARKLRMWALAALAAIGGVFGYHHIAESQATPVTDTLSWMMPTQYLDGGALPIGQIAKTTIVWGAAQGGPYTAGTQDVTSPAVSVVLTRPGNGYGTRCYKAAVTSTGGAQGAWSNEACKTVQAPPGPPTGLTAQ
jgi:hypothetical protein